MWAADRFWAADSKLFSTFWKPFLGCKFSCCHGYERCTMYYLLPFSIVIFPINNN